MVLITLTRLDNQWYFHNFFHDYRATLGLFSCGMALASMAFGLGFGMALAGMARHLVCAWIVNTPQWHPVSPPDTELSFER